MVKTKVDMTGWVISEHGVPDSRLIVLEQTEDYIQPNGKHRAMWKCKCSCGNSNLVIARGDLIQSGDIKSCGCLNIEKSTDRLVKFNKKYNNYDLSGEYGIGWTSNTNKEFYFDLEDFEKIKNYCWYETNYGYICSTNSKHIVQMHRLITGISDKSKDVDHKDHNKNNNRKYNLRICTRSQNSMNKRNVIGVFWDNSRNKWVSKIKLNYKNIFLGYFENFEDAVKSRKEAEEKYFGEFSYDNSINS